jgi:hypothetical protein
MSNFSLNILFSISLSSARVSDFFIWQNYINILSFLQNILSRIILTLD